MILKANKLYKIRHKGIKIGDVINKDRPNEFTPLTDCIILCPVRDREIIDGGHEAYHMIDCLFVVTFTLQLSMGCKTAYAPFSYDNPSRFEKLTASDYLTVAHLLSKTKYRYDHKKQLIINTEEIL